MVNTISPTNPDPDDDDEIKDPSKIFALFLLAMLMPQHQFTGTELSVVMGIGRTSISQIKKELDSPFSLSKCTVKRLDAWLDKHPEYKQRSSKGKASNAVKS